MRLRTLRDQRRYKSQLQLIVEAHRIHVIRRNNDPEELQDLKLGTARELERWIEEMNSLRNDLQGLKYYLRVIRRDDFADRIEDCKSFLLDIIDDYHTKTQARIAAEGLVDTCQDTISDERLASERLRAMATNNDIRTATTNLTTTLQPGILPRIRGLLNRKTEHVQPQTDHSPPKPSVVFRLDSIEHLRPLLESMQFLLSDELEASQSTEAAESNSQSRTTDQNSNSHLQDYCDSKFADSLRELSSDLVNFRSNDTSSDVYEGKRSDDDLTSLFSKNSRSDVDEREYEWPTLVIPERKMYAIAGEDRDYSTEEELPEVYFPDPFNPVHSSSSSEYDSEDDTMTERLSSSSSEEIDPHAGENNSEGDPDVILRRISEVLSEHMIDRSEASTPEEYKSLKAAPGERI